MLPIFPIAYKQYIIDNILRKGGKWTGEKLYLSYEDFVR